MRRSLSLAFALVAAPLVAQPAGSPGAAIESRVQAGTYKVDSSHTQVHWKVSHLGFSNFSGAFADATGTLVFDPRRPNASRLSITIPMDRIVTTSGGLDKHLATPDFFDSAKYPTATFVSTRVQATGTRARIAGILNLHGVPRPVVLDARFVGAGNNPRGNKALNIGFEATARISRGAFGMSYGAPAVSDAVDLQINAAFEKQ